MTEELEEKTPTRPGALICVGILLFFVLASSEPMQFHLMATVTGWWNALLHAPPF